MNQLTISFIYGYLGICNIKFRAKINTSLRGVYFTQFIHRDANHLFSNSVPLFVLLLSLFYFYRDIAYKVLILGGIVAGFLTWCFARESYHIGASGIVYLLFSFVFFSGIIRKHYRLVALSLTIIFLYGSMIWYVLPIKDECLGKDIYLAF